MAFSRKFRLGVYAFLSASLMVSGCNIMPNSESGKPLESLSEKPPRRTAFFTRKKEEFDPIKAHLQARKMVDPSDVSTHHSYTKKKISKKALGPDTSYVTRGKPPPEVRITEMQEPWYAVLLPADSEVDEDIKPAVVPIKKIDSRSALPPEKPASALTRPKAVKSRAAHVPMVVTKLRLGRHPGKTRLVIDLTSAPVFDYQLNNEKNLLVVNLPEAQWDARSKKVFANHPLVLAYIAKSNPDGGTVLAIKLRRDIKVVFESVYKPSKSGGHRIVLDIASVR